MNELRDQKRKIKKQIRAKRREILDLQNNLHVVAQQHKTAKQLAQNKKHREALMAKARKGNLRLSKKEYLKYLEEAA